MTPLMRQYQDIKKQYPEEIILFQVGDFYEIFFEDAQRVAPVLNIVLTKRGSSGGQPIPLCGFPKHSADAHIIKLIQHKFRVVICDQITQAQAGKAIERAVTAVLTPGTLVDSNLITEKSSNYLATIVVEQGCIGLFFLEILTGQSFITTFDTHQKTLLESELARFAPQEILIDSKVVNLKTWLSKAGYVTTLIDAVHDQQMELWLQERSAQYEFLMRSDVLRKSCALMYAYLFKNNKQALAYVKQIALYKPNDFLMLDASTQQNLELVANHHDGSATATLFELLDGAVTTMGSRMIKRWLMSPLIDKAAIEMRHEYVQFFVERPKLCQELAFLLRIIADCERLVGRIALKRAQPSDYKQLMTVLEIIPELVRLLPHTLIATTLQQLSTIQELYSALKNILNADSNRDWLIRSGYHDELDRLRCLVDSGAQAILELERQEQIATGINSLKIRMNQHGYGIEITKPNLHLVPHHYRRLQTLMNRERFTTQALKDLEYDIRRAEVDSAAIEQEIFLKLSQTVFDKHALLRQIAQELATVDAYSGLAQVATRNGYVRPMMTLDGTFMVHRGRHPVVEAEIRKQNKGQFIANNLALTSETPVWVITGPNMGGKSTFLRQNALMVIMAQMGSFVPADSAQIPIFDRIFTRIGAADRVAQGKSTFFVEMEETALICNQATEKSLVILDEVGRGTSTYDGLAIAQAVLEYIYTKIKARCLFATHYHELTELNRIYGGIASYHAASLQTEQGVILLHEIRPGCAQGSFGIEVAKSAQLPEPVIMRAQEILQMLNQNSIMRPASSVPADRMKSSVSL